MTNRRRVLCLSVLSAFTALSLPTWAQERAKPDEAKAMLTKALAHIKAVGKDKAFADFMTKPSPWVDRDLYITVYDLGGKTLAHGVNAKMVGKENLNLQDANGKFIVKERLEIAKAKGKGQQEFAFLNPMTKQIEAKLQYFERLDDVVIAVGAYKPV
jgi:cytochrome c